MLPQLNSPSKLLTLISWVLLSVHPTLLSQEGSRESVNLYLRFLDASGLSVLDMGSDEVEVFDLDTQEEILEWTVPSDPIHVGLVLDVSPSTDRNDQVIRQATSEFFRSMSSDALGMILTFDSEIYVDSDWTLDRKELDEAIFEFGLQKPGSTSVIYDALALSLGQKFDQGARQVMVFFSDGVEIGSQDFSEKEALELVREAGVLVYSIQYDSRRNLRRLYSGGRIDPLDPQPPRSSNSGGIFIGRPGANRDMDEYKVRKTFERATKTMRQVAEAGRGKHFLLSGQKGDLARVYEEILASLSDVYTARYVPSAPRRDGRLHPLIIRSKRPGVEVQALTKGYWSLPTG